MPGTFCQVGRLVRRPGGPPRQMLKYVTRLTPLTEEGQGGRGKKGARDKVTKRRREKKGVEWGRRPRDLSYREARLSLDIYAGDHTPLLMGPVCLRRSPGPVRPGRELRNICLI